MRRWRLAMAFALLVGGAAARLAAGEGIVLRVKGTNPSELEEKPVEVKSYLPKGIKPENVIDAAGMEVQYDHGKEQYYVAKTELVMPKKSVEYRVEIENIWKVDEKKLELFQRHTGDLQKQLTGTEYENPGNVVMQRIQEHVKLAAEQDRAAVVDGVKVPEYIEARQGVQRELQAIRDYTGVMETLVTMSGKQPGQLLGSPCSREELLARHRDVLGAAAGAQTNWRVLVGILVVLAVVSVAFFFVWSRQVRKLRSVAEIAAESGDDGV